MGDDGEDGGEHGVVYSCWSAAMVLLLDEGSGEGEN